MTTAFAGESVPRPVQTTDQNDGDIAAVASERLRCLARAVRYINSPKRRRNCSSKRSSMVSALSRTIALNSSLKEAHSLGLVSREYSFRQLVAEPPHDGNRPSCRSVSDALLRVLKPTRSGRLRWLVLRRPQCLGP